MVGNEYLKWLKKFIKSKEYSPELYNLLLKDLLSIDFVYYYPMDENRAIDGIDLRYRFLDEKRNVRVDYDDFLNSPCTVLEMMIALAIRCEEDIMGDENVGDRTSYWFWNMVACLGLIKCTDDNYDDDMQYYIHGTVARFLVRDYDERGYGGLFAIDQGNIRDKEIWYQMCDYLNYIIERRD